MKVCDKCNNRKKAIKAYNLLAQKLIDCVEAHKLITRTQPFNLTVIDNLEKSIVELSEKTDVLKTMIED